MEKEGENTEEVENKEEGKYRMRGKRMKRNNGEDDTERLENK
jgi:hypothetical protein